MGGSDSSRAESLKQNMSWVNFSQIKNRVTLEQVLSGYGVDGLRRSGPQQYRGRCPIHRGEGAEAFHANLGRDRRQLDLLADDN